MNTILPFSGTEILPIDQVGGKALSLITMLKTGMPVPPGFVLTVSFFAPWITALQATPQWQAVQNSGREELGQAAQALVSLCGNLQYTQAQKEELGSALESFQSAQPVTLFAVRSSSPEEDLAGASFAGGYETTLGVTLEQMEAAIIHSFASSFEERVFLYKKEHGFSIDQPRIAVIVQQQIDADCAGVAFSLNPLNNCFDEAVINANFGLGESVVAGEADPDVFVVDKIDRKILEAHPGRKEVVVQLNSAGGTTRSSRVGDSQACLTPAQVLELVDLLVRVENYYDRPVDIEWAISHQKLYLLQARPITTYLPLPEEMVTAPGSPKHLYADSTLIEQGVQEPLSVLGADFLTYVLQQVSGPVGGDVIGIDGVAFTAGGRYYIHLSNKIKMTGPKAPLAPGSTGDESVLAILDAIDLKQYLPKKLPKKLAASRRKMIFTMLPAFLPALKATLGPEAFRQKYLEALPRQL
jgi:pyruvate,water dikinase